MGLTENDSVTYLSSGHPCVDFFFHVVPGTTPEHLIGRLQLSWAYDPLTTLKLIGNLRGIRGTGKFEKESFYTAALWLHLHHPKTLALNVAIFAEFGYYKDLLEILYRLVKGLDVRANERGEQQSRRCTKGKRRRHGKMDFPLKCGLMTKTKLERWRIKSD